MIDLLNRINNDQTLFVNTPLSIFVASEPQYQNAPVFSLLCGNISPSGAKSRYQGSPSRYSLFLYAQFATDPFEQLPMYDRLVTTATECTLPHQNFHERTWQPHFTKYHKRLRCRIH